MGDVKPNGTFSCIIDDSKQLISRLTEHDVLVVFGGTNDVGSIVDSNFDKTKFLEKVQNLVNLTVNTKLFFVGLPFRRDIPKLNNLITCINYDVQNLLSKVNHAQFVSLSSLYNPRLYTKFGLHFNNFGKKLIAQKLCDAIFSPPIGLQNPHQISVISSSNRPSTNPSTSARQVFGFKTKVFTNKSYFLGTVPSKNGNS